jgi:hypothetical protein
VPNSNRNARRDKSTGDKNNVKEIKLSIQQRTSTLDNSYHEDLPEDTAERNEYRQAQYSKREHAPRSDRAHNNNDIAPHLVPQEFFLPPVGSHPTSGTQRL